MPTKYIVLLSPFRSMVVFANELPVSRTAYATSAPVESSIRITPVVSSSTNDATSTVVQVPVVPGVISGGSDQ